MKKLMRELFMYIAAGLCLWFCICLVRSSAEVKESVISAVMRCINVIIPSLFAFMAAADILISSGLYIYITKPFGFLARRLFNIPSGMIFVVLAANTAGYPMGVKMLSDMQNKGIVSRRNAALMACWCFCGGPAFYSGTVGLGVFGQAKVGTAVFLSIVLANVIMGVVLRFFVKKDNVDISSVKNDKAKLTAENITSSVISAGKSLFVICVMIVFFAAVMAVIDHTGVFNKLSSLGLSDNEVTLIKSCFEITNITELTGQPYDLLPQITAVCSFGGLCVLLQVIALSGGMNLVPFIISRVPAAFLSAVICRFISPLFVPTVLEAANQQTKIFVKINNFVPSVCLIMMILLLILKKRLAFYKTV
ncbi:nucleoside recognition protein [Ruminococcus sp.]|uniref:nucleoside recognition protein n=1 Tax=Ruminococcus sp. TaxID=41978 RepID=UPI0025ED91AD|nr:nucleoside recognition protein [Ruminococcus sp.]